MFTKLASTGTASTGTVRRLIIGMLFFGLFQGIAFGNAPPTSQYILCIRPVDAFGDELQAYFEGVKSYPFMRPNSIKNCLGRCELTKYFPKRDTETALKNALKKAVATANISAKTISIIGIVRGLQANEKDCITLGSRQLLTLAKVFFQHAGIHTRYLLNPADFPYSITLRNHPYKTMGSPNTADIIRKQAQINLRSRVRWNVTLLRKSSGPYLDVLLELPLK